MSAGREQLVPCMGGWCLQRATCANYHSKALASPDERLCMPGRDGVSRWPVVMQLIAIESDSVAVDGKAA